MKPFATVTTESGTSYQLIKVYERIAVHVPHKTNTHLFDTLAEAMAFVADDMGRANIPAWSHTYTDAAELEAQP